MKKDADTFIIKPYKADFSRGKVDFCYEIARDGKKIPFQETIKFPLISDTYAKKNIFLLSRILENLSLILGISYWKTYCPQTIKIESFALSKKEANFWNIVYSRGLGEFFYKNKIDFTNLIRFPYEKKAYRGAFRMKTNNASLLLFGGGKDSIVACEMLKKNKKSFSLFMIGESAIQKEATTQTGKHTIVFKRTIDHALLRLNKKQGVLNGHVPASAIYAFSGVFASALYGFRSVIASNEKSANYGNVRWHGAKINHQWSKSAEFERMLTRHLTTSVSPDIRYSSLLRPLFELDIIRKFTAFPKYFPYFSSCNRNFRILKKADKKWCGKCPKCAFVFAGLAAFLPQQEMITIFRKNLFEDKKLIPLYKELLGIGTFKPFECVGTPEETKHAFLLAEKRGEYNNSAIMRMVKTMYDTGKIKK